MVESLIHGNLPAAPAPGDAAAAPGAPGAPATAPAAGVDAFAGLAGKLPEKFQVKGTDGQIDSAASLTKALEHRDHLEQRLGRGEVPPKTAAEYHFTPPDELKDFQFTSEKFTEFKTEAHKLGFTQAQYDFAMKSYLNAVPELMEGAAALTAAEARAELQKVWPVTTDYEANIENATRALRALPADLQEATREFGTDPAFLRAMAHFGAQLREDRGPGTGSPAAAPDIDALRRSEAYTNPRHPDHQRVSAQVRAHFDKAYGTAPTGTR